MTLDQIEVALNEWKDNLCPSLSATSLSERNPIVYKWKTPYNCIILRETVSWRLHDLLAQSYSLHKHNHELGARILLRSGLETLAIMIYLNLHIRQVIDGSLCFDSFGTKIVKLLLGERLEPRGPEAINIMTVLEKCNDRYPRIKDIYGDLSESAHPNFKGLLAAYSIASYDGRETKFSNLWVEKHARKFGDLIKLVATTFDCEYNNVWDELFVQLEDWIEENDASLVVAYNASRG
jgi:hypothetical protein